MTVWKSRPTHLPTQTAMRSYCISPCFMNLRPMLASILVATCFTGCATFSDQEIGQMRQRGVSPVVVGKMAEGHVLTPPDIIELTRRGVPDDFIIRQIDDAGVDYVLSRSDFKRLQEARVSRPVMDA